MSELQEALDLFGFTSIDKITPQSLKYAFKTVMLSVHPDKGGNSEEFDKMYSSYVFLSEAFQKIHGGREILKNIVSSDELCNMRPDEIINKMFDEFHNEEFDKQFLETHKSIISEKGYDTWLKNTDNDTNLMIGEKYGDATQKPPTFDPKDLNNIFEETLKKDKPVQETTSIILHPEEMAYVSGNTLGTSIIPTDEGSFTSNIFTNPEYTDVYSAFTNDNILSNKVPLFVESNKSYNDLKEERNSDITPLDDKELQALMEFEKKKLENNTTHLSKVKEYFWDNRTTSVQTSLENWPPEKYSAKDYKGFVHSF